MKITSFNPFIVTKNPDDLIKLFEELGFERAHQKDGIEGDITSVRMTDANGFHVDVAHSPRMEKDLPTIRMNVDNFETAYQFFIDRGFKNPMGDHLTDTASSRSALMISPTGFSICITEHIKS